MIFRDDECRIRTEHAPANFTTIEHNAHNLTRKAAGKHSFRLTRSSASAPMPAHQLLGHHYARQPAQITSPTTHR
jgi:hypothetical protein